MDVIMTHEEIEEALKDWFMREYPLLSWEAFELSDNTSLVLKKVQIV